MEKDRYELNSGRKRPSYKPIDIKCKNCGAGLEIKDERAELVVCSYCGSHLDVSGVEKKILNKGTEKSFEFPLAIGDSFRLKSVRYEVIARLAFIEDNDPRELSRQYYLYHPTKGTMWLDEYQGQYSTSTVTHVMPQKEPFAVKRGEVLKTHDGMSWVREDQGTYETIYVDGALPWIAKIGDKIDYVEFVEKDGPDRQYEVQKIRNEIEFGIGHAVSIDMVRKATGKPNLQTPQKRKSRVNAAKLRRDYRTLLFASLLFVIINLLTLLYAAQSGRVIFNQTFSPNELNGESYSKQFTISRNNEIVKFLAKADIDNAWMALSMALVDASDKVLHTFEMDMSYYHGYEGGEHWSEGSQSTSELIKIPEAGEYKLLVHAVSAAGNSENADQARHCAGISLKTGAMPMGYSVFMTILAGIVLFITFSKYSQWKNEDDD